MIDSQVHEEISEMEFIKLYNDRAQELNELQGAVNQGKGQLQALGQIEETEELKKFVENLIKAEGVKQKQKLIMDLQAMETNLSTKKKELERLTPTMKELNDKLKAKQDGERKVSEDAAKTEAKEPGSDKQ